jgi:hypothetical protein
MEYEVCSVVTSISFIRVDFYKTLDNYEKGRPDVIVVILRNTSFMEQIEELIEELIESYKGAEIIVLGEGKEAIRVYNDCKRARKFIVIPPLLQ